MIFTVGCNAQTEWGRGCGGGGGGADSPHVAQRHTPLSARGLGLVHHYPRIEVRYKLGWVAGPVHFMQ